MNIDRVRAMLEQSAEAMMELSKVLGKTGRPVTLREKQMIRAATLPVILDITDQMVLNHLQGIPQDLDHISNELSMLSFD